MKLGSTTNQVNIKQLLSQNGSARCASQPRSAPKDKAESASFQEQMGTIMQKRQLTTNSNVAMTGSRL